MRPPKTEAAAPVGTGNDRDIGSAFSEGNLPTIYFNRPVSANEFRIAVLNRRFRLPIPVARVVAELAFQTGRAA